MSVTNIDHLSLLSSKRVTNTSSVTSKTNEGGTTLPHKVTNALNNHFSQSLLAANKAYSSSQQTNNANITKNEELSEVEAHRKLASAMPFLIQALDNLEAQATELGDTYNKLTTNGGKITKSDILILSSLEEDIGKTRAEIELIMQPLDDNEPQTKLLSNLLLPVFEGIDDELKTLTKFNEEVEGKLASIELESGNLELDFTFKLNQENFNLIDQDRRLLPFSFVADDLRVITDFLNQNFDNGGAIVFQTSIKKTEDFIRSFEKYQEDRNEDYLSQRKLRNKTSYS
ncbi:hypothetical protein [uncultured Paraglaciecola sp.]|uniref:hypothetical protein n=1 Tax=uncultured Paraglaciecola sp. TaxID=1765024 RepID=UPI00259A667A|nr:hypothetical protein [uncultured Paraglaciecola sp.]